MDKKQYFHVEDSHIVTPVICLNCRKEWMAVHPVDVNVEQLECPGCGEQGYAVETGAINPFNALKIKHERKKKIEFLKAHPLCVGCQQHGYYRKATSVYWTSDEGCIALCEYHYEEITISGIPDEIVTWKTSEVLSVLNKNSGL